MALVPSSNGLQVAALEEKLNGSEQANRPGTVRRRADETGPGCPFGRDGEGPFGSRKMAFTWPFSNQDLVGTLEKHQLFRMTDPKFIRIHFLRTILSLVSPALWMLRQPFLAMEAAFGLVR